MTTTNRNTDSKDSRRRGERHYRAKLTATVVRAIRLRLLAGDSHPAIARLYGVSPDAVFDIAKNRTWAWLDGGTPTEQLPPPHGARGSGAGMARLTEHEVREIRQMLAAGYTMGMVARAYAVSPDAIFDIAHGRTWRWMADEDDAA
jgi:hypothetical protein